MKAFLLAAGSGSRLRPLTNQTPKCLLPVGGVPLLAYWLENCERAGVDEVLINSHAHTEKVLSFVRGYKGKMRLRVAEEPQLLGSAGTLWENRHFVDGEDSFLVLYADVLTNIDLNAIVSFHDRHQSLATIGVYQVPDPQRCGIVTFDEEGTVRSFVEKPKQPASNWAFSGIMMASPKILDVVPRHRPADIGFDLLPQLVGSMAAYPIADFLMDIGTPENYRAAQSLWPGFSSDTMQSTLEAVIFDFDGVLVDSHPAHKEAWRRFLHLMGRKVTEEELSFVAEGHRREDILHHFLGALTTKQVKHYGNLKDSLFRDLKPEPALIPGVKSILEELRAAGIPAAVASSGSRSRVERTLEQVNIRSFFRTVVAADDVSRGKPDPAAFCLAADRMGVKTRNTLVCEDAIAGVSAAKAAGMKCLGIATNGREAMLRQAGADWVVADFSSVQLADVRRVFNPSPAYSKGIDARGKRKVPPAYSRADESARELDGRRDDV